MLHYHTPDTQGDPALIPLRAVYADTAEQPLPRDLAVLMDRLRTAWANRNDMTTPPSAAT